MVASLRSSQDEGRGYCAKEETIDDVGGAHNVGLRYRAGLRRRSSGSMAGWVGHKIPKCLFKQQLICEYPHSSIPRVWGTCSPHPNQQRHRSASCHNLFFAGPSASATRHVGPERDGAPHDNNFDLKRLCEAHNPNPRRPPRGAIEYSCQHETKKTKCLHHKQFSGDEKCFYFWQE